MDKGFTIQGKLIEADSPECFYLLTTVNNRTALFLKSSTIDSASIYSFGRLAFHGIQAEANWSTILEHVPDPVNTEKAELKEKLLSQREANRAYLQDELESEAISEDTYEQLTELFSRLFPAYGHFIDKVNFLSDNYYGFEPSWHFDDFHVAPDFKSLVTEAFGVYRKDLARSVAKSSGSTIALLSLFRNSITMEQMIELLEESKLSSKSGWAIVSQNIRNTVADLSSFDRLNPALRFRLVKDLLATIEISEDEVFGDLSMIEDSLTMLASVSSKNLKRFRSDRTWEEVHNRAMELASDESVEKLNSLSLPAMLTQLDGSVMLERLKLRLLRTPLDFVRAGSKHALDNCMAKSGYYSKAKQGESYCLVIYDLLAIEECSQETPQISSELTAVHSEITAADSTVDNFAQTSEAKGRLSTVGLVAGVELQLAGGRWRVLQLKGASNRPLEDRELISSYLLEVLGTASSSSQSSSSPKRSPSSTVARADALSMLESLQTAASTQRILHDRVELARNFQFSIELEPELDYLDYPLH